MEQCSLLVIALCLVELGQEFHVETVTPFQVLRARVHEVADKEQELEELLELVAVLDVTAGLDACRQLMLDFILQLGKLVLVDEASQSLT